MAQSTIGRPGPRRSLAEGDIVAAATSLLDQGGAAALSMRAVAGAVGVAPNALYTYFRTKTALLHAILVGFRQQADRGPMSDRVAQLPHLAALRADLLALRDVLTAVLMGWGALSAEGQRGAAKPKDGSKQWKRARKNPSRSSASVAAFRGTFSRTATSTSS